ncbi:MAG: SPOR domain-containing protein [Candidatus Binatia bacterium]
MAENRRNRDKRFYFSRGQLVLLGGAFVLSSLVIFLLGIMVGRGIEERKMAKPEEPLIKIPVKPSSQGGAAASGGQAKEELTFYNTLAKRSGAESTFIEKTNELNEPGKPVQAEAREAKAKDREESRPVSPPVEKEPPVEMASSVHASNSAEDRESGTTWHVQVNAFPDEKSGKVWVDKLKSKGYKAYLTEARNKGKVWYRVRVGQFRSREEAEKMVDILKNRENFAKAFATRQ